MKNRVKKIIYLFISVLALVELFGCICINFLMFRPKLIHVTYNASSEGFVDIGDNGNKIAAVVLGPEHGKKAIIRCHGNAENMYQSVHVLRNLARQGYTVASVDYPGYGLSSGRPTENGCYRNVHRLYDWLIKERGFEPKNIIVHGFSIGSGSATELATTCEVGGLILEAPFLSAPRVMTRVRILPIDPFPNARRIRDGLKCPLLILHGTDDHVVPYWHGEELYRLSKMNAGDLPRMFVTVEGAGHSNIPQFMEAEKYLRQITDFAESLD